ncbi:sulfatase [Candidatus Poribacteria bacterium]
MDRPNILYIFTDQQYAGAMSCAGNTDLHTPAMDSIAESGVRFERAYCTYPLCTPARASMFSGRMPHEVGITGNGQPIDEKYRQEELGHLLTNAGYECAYGGKWHVPQISIPDIHGFRRICGFNDVGLPVRCREFLEEPRDKPFFLVAAFDNPHNICEWRRQQVVPWGPIGEPPRVEDCPPLPANFAIPPFEPEAIRVAIKGNTRIYPDSGYPHEQWRRYRWAYYRLVEKVDEQIGQILKALRGTGFADNTLIIFSSDHGDGHGAHQLVQKTFMYDEATRVPFLVSVPGMIKGGHVDDRHVVSNGLDFYATVCDFAGVDLPEGINGRSVRPLLDGSDDVEWTDHLVVETRFGQSDSEARMVRTEQYKYMVYGWGAYREQLFDMEKDPGEMVNLAVCSKYGDVLQHHRDLLRAWCEETGDTFNGHHYSHPGIPFRVPGDEYPQSV